MIRLPRCVSSLNDRVLRLIGSLLIAFFVFSCQPRIAKAPPKTGPRFLIHTVQYGGETFGVIARWYTGESANWRRIAEANPALDPRMITIGSRVFIPDEMLVRRDALPKRALLGKAFSQPPQGTNDSNGAAEIDSLADTGAEATDSLENSLGGAVESTAELQPADDERKRLWDALLDSPS